MNFRLILLAAITGCVALLFAHTSQARDFDNSSDTLKGPCERATPTYPNFDCTNDDCSGIFGSCNDGPLRLITWAAGTCEGREGACRLLSTTKDKYAKVDCGCQDDGVTCEYEGYIYSGSTTVTDCVVVSVGTD